MDAVEQPRSLLIKPASGDCNLHCTYCFYHDRVTDPYKQQSKRRMGPEVLDALIKQGMRLDRRHATFGWQGGEPTLMGLDFYKKVVELQQKYGARGQAVSNGLQTNGVLLNPDWAGFLRQYHFLLGVSLDGPAKYHDHYRVYSNGGPTHERVLDTLHMLEENRVEYNVLSVVNNLTGGHPVEIYDYFLSEGFFYLQFIPCVEVDPTTGQITEFSVGPEQYGDFLCALFDRWYNNGEPGKDKAWKFGGELKGGGASLFGQYEYDDGLISIAEGISGNDLTVESNETEGADVWHAGVKYTNGKILLIGQYGKRKDSKNGAVDEDGAPVKDGLTSWLAGLSIYLDESFYFYTGYTQKEYNDDRDDDSRFTFGATLTF